MAICIQGAIVWRQIFNGRIPRHWWKHQGKTKLSSGKVQMDCLWGVSIAENRVHMMINLWKLRNKEVHGKEEATKQEKRKDKAAISVRALHDLEVIVRPSDSFIFYQDLEQEIE